MSTVSTVAASATDCREPGRELPRLAADPGAALHLLVLAADEVQCVGIDLGSGTLVRAWWDEPPAVRPPRYQAVAVTLAPDPDLVPDPFAPEGLALAGAAEPIGRVPGHRAERLLRRALHPTDEPLLGTHASAVPLWERSRDRPSTALIEPQSRVVLGRDPGSLACRFAWQGTVRELPCLDRRMAGEMHRRGQRDRVLRRRTRLVIALAPPVNGLCPKVVAAVLPRP